MLRQLRLVEQWTELESRLPAEWDEARLLLVVEDGAVERAVELLGPAAPGRRRDAIVLVAQPLGGPASPEGLRRLLGRLDAEGLAGRLELAAATEASAREPARQPTLVEAWDGELAKLPPDWSDALVEVEFRASDQVRRAALLMSPLNPSRPPGHPDASALRFRSASRFGYGASSGMVRRCLERCDEEELRGIVRLLLVLADTEPVGTQGPVWYLSGRAS